jgi:hypothetical protein
MSDNERQGWETIESVHQHMERAAKWAAKAARESVEETPELLNYCEPPMESPIEAIFQVWWHAVGLFRVDPAGVILSLFPQHEVALDDHKYRLDFTVGYQDPDLLWAAHLLKIPAWKIGVELDGHNWHERTKEQVAIRNSRDRELLQAGWIIFHYSGSELYRDPVRCVTEVMDAAMAKHYDMERAVWAARRERGWE